MSGPQPEVVWPMGCFAQASGGFVLRVVIFRLSSGWVARGVLCFGVSVARVRDGVCESCKWLRGTALRGMSSRGTRRMLFRRLSRNQ